ncbi:hypothetical protein BHE74_00035956 [Ensete ventricosum]|nr:hypothetical protein GW17_00031857 [Ensete ventricosum]RWW57273.1 hypothetical protein BHE74_00035956 [Ensete ventricosum]RZS15733.1 hypothetical protein BHM03_00047608 [Ensete ventricosum]
MATDSARRRHRKEATLTTALLPGEEARRKHQQRRPMRALRIECDYTVAWRFDRHRVRDFDPMERADAADPHLHGPTPLDSRIRIGILTASFTRPVPLNLIYFGVPQIRSSVASPMAEVTEEGPKEAEANRDWSELTPVCLANVLRRLTLEDRWKGVMLVCRSWLAAARDLDLYAALDLEPSFESAGSSRADSAEWWTPAFQRRVDAMLRSAAVWAEGSLREIRVRHCSDEALCFAAER